MDRLLHFDLHTKAMTPWFRKPGMQVQAIGFDSQGDPIVDAETMMSQSDPRPVSQELWIVRGHDGARRIYTGPGSIVAGVANFSSVLADDHGVWFGSNLGIFLYTSDGQFRRVTTSAADVAGRCS
ncbi:MAG TPA: hypothetical protein VFR68_15750 [Candidatus Dormibacteraeota bacterium]|nr:hypothetical protein [Candidatus Dormibacteraeota bacterium]